MSKSSLTETQKERISQLKKDGFSQTKIANFYGVSQGTISNVLKDQAHKEEIAMPGIEWLQRPTLVLILPSHLLKFPH